jgi:hypothetical protein
MIELEDDDMTRQRQVVAEVSGARSDSVRTREAPGDEIHDHVSPNPVLDLRLAPNLRQFQRHSSRGHLDQRTVERR